MLTKHTPLLTNLSDLHQLMNRMLQPNLLEGDIGFGNVIANWTPTIDVKDEQNQYVISADIPGVDPKNIDVRMENGILTIKGNKETKTKEKRENYVYLERSEGSFCRSMSLPNAVDSTKINAKIKNGVLEIIVPKTKESTSHKVKIKEE